MNAMELLYFVFAYPWLAAFMVLSTGLIVAGIGYAADRLLSMLAFNWYIDGMTKLGTMPLRDFYGPKGKILRAKLDKLKPQVVKSHPIRHLD